MILPASKMMLLVFFLLSNFSRGFSPPIRTVQSCKGFGERRKSNIFIENKSINFSWDGNISCSRIQYNLIHSSRKRSLSRTLPLYGWLDNFLPKYDAEEASNAENARRAQYPEQYPATYELMEENIPGDDIENGSTIVRPLLKQTQLEQRCIRLAYDASIDGWDAESFHKAIDGKGATIVLAITREGKMVGGYNPKGWASMGGARPSVASFLYYSKSDNSGFQKIRKVGGGGLACTNDNPSFGISFGPDGLVIGLQPGRERWAQSKLGTYYERGPMEMRSLFDGACELKELKAFVGVYESGEDIPYSGAVLDMTSG